MTDANRTTPATEWLADWDDAHITGDTTDAELLDAAAAMLQEAWDYWGARIDGLLPYLTNLRDERKTR